MFSDYLFTFNLYEKIKNFIIKNKSYDKDIYELYKLFISDKTITKGMIFKPHQYFRKTDYTIIAKQLNTTEDEAAKIYDHDYWSNFYINYFKYHNSKSLLVENAFPYYVEFFSKKKIKDFTIFLFNRFRENELEIKKLYKISLL